MKDELGVGVGELDGRFAHISTYVVDQDVELPGERLRRGGDQGGAPLGGGYVGDCKRRQREGERELEGRLRQQQSS